MKQSESGCCLCDGRPESLRTGIIVGCQGSVLLLIFFPMSVRLNFIGQCPTVGGACSQLSDADPVC